MNRLSLQSPLKVLCVLVLHLLLTHCCRGNLNTNMDPGSFSLYHCVDEKLSPKLLQFILSKTWISLPNFEAIHPTVSFKTINVNLMEVPEEKSVTKLGKIHCKQTDGHVLNITIITINEKRENLLIHGGLLVRKLSYGWQTLHWLFLNENGVKEMNRFNFLALIAGINICFSLQVSPS